MKKLITTCLIVLIILGTVGVAKAYVDPYVSVTTTSSALEFGRATFAEGSSKPGKALFPNVLYSASASLTVKVDSNCMHGAMAVSMTELKHSGGRTIPLERIAMKAPTTSGYVPLIRPVIISDPQAGPHNIDLEFRVERLVRDRAGKYSGNIILTMMPLPLE
ncbi:MAG: hypothetical protein PVJ60_01570 [Phycisphaerales bacterium]|jgi:hypothetical protein